METAKERYSPDSPGSVRLYEQITTRVTSHQHTIRENYLHKVHARAADFISPGCGPV